MHNCWVHGIDHEWLTAMAAFFCLTTLRSSHCVDRVSEREECMVRDKGKG